MWEGITQKNHFRYIKKYDLKVGDSSFGLMELLFIDRNMPTDHVTLASIIFKYVVGEIFYLAL